MQSTHSSDVISAIEAGIFLSLFNRGGYVLDFSTSRFDTFTEQSIGVALCERYGLSKGKSLEQYVGEADAVNVAQLLGDLLAHYEMHYQNEIVTEGKYRQYYLKCRAVIDRVRAARPQRIDQVEQLKSKFSSEYISAQIEIMFDAQHKNPTEAIGKAKEFIESCCYTILEENCIAIDKNWNVSQLVKKTMSFLRITPEDISQETPESRIVKAMLGNLQSIAGSLAELRNAYGSGHGKAATYKGLSPRHAKLAVSSSVALVTYLMDTYELRKAAQPNE